MAFMSSFHAALDNFTATYFCIAWMTPTRLEIELA